MANFIKFFIIIYGNRAVMYMHGYVNGGNLLTTGFILTAYGMGLWFRDVVTEGTYLGDHTKQVKKGLQMGVILFMLVKFLLLKCILGILHASLSTIYRNWWNLASTRYYTFRSFCYTIT